MTAAQPEGFDTRDILKSPPIVEALLEIRCTCEEHFGLVPGALFGEVKATLPVHQQLPQAMLGGFPIDDPNLRWLVHHRMQDKAETKMVQVGPQVFTANVMGRYSRYEDFEQLLTLGLTAYKKVARPIKVQRVGLRYINLIPSEIAARFPQPLRINANYPKDTLGAWKSVVAKAQFSFPEIKGDLSLSVAFPQTIHPGTPKERQGLYVDFDVFNEAPFSDDVMAYIPWAKSANMKIYQIFKSVISPDLYTFLKDN